MSGFEIAGLILGVVPLAIAALEQYKTAHEMLRYFNHKSVYIDRLIQALEEQRFCLESEFDIVLRAAGFEPQDLGAISGEYLQTFFLRRDVAEELSRYLGRGYDPYRKALVRCENSLGEIVRNIGGLVPGSPSGDLREVLRANESKEGKYEFKKRIKFSLKKDELQRRIGELINATNTLRRLRETTVSLHDNGIQSSSRTIAKFATFLQLIQRHADSLYGAIAQRLASGCHYEHGTKFYLEGQSAVLQKKLLPIDFKLAIEAPQARAVEGNIRHEICIEVLEDRTAKYDLSMPL
ncbi:MAG: hypothetical protein ASARMPREDX12_006281 [Alectoria sarmentosa]|nr:MAG: hypothetical protein ASARMPREDX12_006281 [Alectoria sarmentosa]